MNKLMKLALVVVIVAGLGSLALTAKLAGSKRAQKEEITRLNGDLNTTAGNLVAAKKTLEQTSATLGQTQSALDQAKADVQATRATLGQREQELQTAKTQLADNEKTVTDAKEKVAATERDAEALRKALKDAGVEDVSKLSEVVAKIAAQGNENKILAGKLEQISAENTQLKQQLAVALTPPDARVPASLRGKIALVDSRWNFVVFDLGERDQVKAGAEFLIYHANKMVGKLQVVSVGATTSTGQLLPEFARGTPCSGDLVVH